MRRLAAMAVLSATAVCAEGLTGYVEEDYTHTDQRSAGEKDHIDAFTQRYRLALDRAVFPLLRFSASGVFEELDANTSDGAAAGWNRDRTVSGFANLTLGGTILTGTGAYTFRSEQVTGTPGRLNQDEPSVFVNYHPSDLPAWTVRVARTHVYDTAFEIEDVTTLLGQVTASWSPLRSLSLLYSGSIASPDDQLHSTQTTQVAQSARLDWTAVFDEGRTTIAAGLNAIDQRSVVSSSGGGGRLTTQQSPIAGLSAVEVFPATSSLDTLAASPPLVDGNTSVSAGVDIGFALQLSGDRNPRDFGAQFSDVLTPVNTLYVWLDRQLTAQVAGAYQWSVWQSDDNLHWTELPIVSPVVFGAFQNRFEITIASVQARYLKAVVKPLDPGATVDRRFSNVFVTELQLLLVAQVRTRTPWQDSARAVATAGGRTQITRTVAYDLSGIVTRITASRTRDVHSYLLTNGVSYADKLGEIFVVNARVARQDQDLSHGHEGLFVYSSSLTATPLPTLSHSLVYSGQSLWGIGGFQTTNALSFFNRASPYRGVGLLAGAVYSVNTGPRGAVLKSDNVTCSATVTPNPKLTVSGTFGHADTVSTGGGAPRSSSSANQITAGATATPVPALYLSIGLTRLVSSSTPHTLASGSAGFSPFPGGNLQLAVNYLETYQDPNQTSRLFSPSIRWNVRPNALLTVSWSLLDSNAVGAATQARTFEADLQISF